MVFLGLLQDPELLSHFWAPVCPRTGRCSTSGWHLAGDSVLPRLSSRGEAGRGRGRPHSWFLRILSNCSWALIRGRARGALLPGCGEGGQRPSGLGAWEILEDPRPARGLAGSLSPPGGRPQSASGDRGELSSKDSGRLSLSEDSSPWSAGDGESGSVLGDGFWWPPRPASVSSIIHSCC